LQNSLPNGFPENRTDSKSESFGGLVFAKYFSPQRSIVNVETNPRDSRQGLTPAKDIFKHFQFFKKHQRSFFQFFRQQLHRLRSVTIVFCVFTRRAGFDVIQR
jgi:hypothetical protein